MYPTPHAMTTPLGTRREIGRDLKFDLLLPRTSVVDADHREVFWLNLGDITLISNTDSASFDILGVRALPRITGMHSTDTT